MRGRLLSLLRAARNSVNIPPSVQCVRTIINPLAPRQLAGFAHDIARGMEYIAEKKVIYIPKFWAQFVLILKFFFQDCSSRLSSTKYSS